MDLQLPIKLLSTLSFLLLASSAQSSDTGGFKCSIATTCNALVGYTSPNSTTLSSLLTKFSVSSLQSILAVNSKLPSNTSSNHKVPSNTTVWIPFPCRCSNGTGISDKVPVYTIVPGDGLYHIAAEVFGGLTTYDAIAAVNGVKNVNLIYAGRNLTIPLPCSCDEVNGKRVVHYGHVVKSGSNLTQIARDFGSTVDTLLNLNGLSDPKSLKAGQVLDIPLKGCSSAVNSTSLDFPLMGVNGTSILTANGCVTCKCNPSDSFMLQCQPSGLKPSNWTTCPAIKCTDGSSTLYLGNTITSSVCSTSTCSYAGYTKQTILTTLDANSTCPAAQSPSANGSNSLHQSWRLAFVVLCIHLMVILSSTFSKEGLH